MAGSNATQDISVGGNLRRLASRKISAVGIEGNVHPDVSFGIGGGVFPLLDGFDCTFGQDGISTDNQNTINRSGGRDHDIQPNHAADGSALQIPGIIGSHLSDQLSFYLLTLLSV
jgi:hypothetical protein